MKHICNWGMIVKGGELFSACQNFGMVAFGIVSGYQFTGICPKHKYFDQNLKKKNCVQIQTSKNQ